MFERERGKERERERDSPLGNTSAMFGGRQPGSATIAPFRSRPLEGANLESFIRGGICPGWRCPMKGLGRR